KEESLQTQKRYKELYSGDPNEEELDEPIALSRKAADHLRSEAHIFLKEDKDGNKHTGLSAKHWDEEGTLVYLRKWAKVKKLSTKYIQKSMSIPEVFRLICDQMVLIKFVQYDGIREIRYKYDTLIYITMIIKSYLKQEFSMKRISWKDL